MKKTLCTVFMFIFGLFVSLPVISQDINPLLYENTWRDNETKTINGFNITKIFGQLADNPSTYNFSPITAVGYKSLISIKSDIKKAAISENWSEEKLSENINNIQKTSAGGQIQVYLTRYVEENANFKWFFIVIRGIDDKNKIWEYEMPYKAPQNPVNSGWWNYTTIEIPVELPDSFYVYLNDKQSKFLSDFKFLIDKSNDN